LGAALGFPSHSERKWASFFFREVVQLDPTPDVEGGGTSVANQIGGSRHTEQAERKPE
jgi:hypothetical protein